MLVKFSQPVLLKTDANNVKGRNCNRPLSLNPRTESSPSPRFVPLHGPVVVIGGQFEVLQCQLRHMTRLKGLIDSCMSAVFDDFPMRSDKARCFYWANVIWNIGSRSIPPGDLPKLSEG